MKAQAIIQRELIVSGKSWKTYVLRVLPPLFVLVILGATWLGGDVAKTTVRLGVFIFAISIITSAGYAGLAGFFVSDCISREREDNTLGLLFLTPLKSWDVILGKLISSGKTHLQSILTLLPLEAMAFPLGGITMKSFLVMNTFILVWLIYTISAGICISSLSTNQRMSSILSIIFTAFVTIGVCILIPLSGLLLVEIGILESHSSIGEWSSYLFPFTPIGIFFLLAQSLFSPSSGMGHTYQLCWVGMGFLLIQASIFLWFATRTISKVWRQRATRRKTRFNGLYNLFRRLDLGPATYRAKLRLKLLGVHPYDWITGRSRTPTIILWILWCTAVLPVISLFYLSLQPLNAPLKDIALVFPSTSLLIPTLITAPLCFISCVVLKYWVAWMVCMRIQRDVHTGMLPLIMLTTVTPQQVILSQIVTLFKRMWIPLLLTFGIVAYYASSYSSQTDIKILEATGHIPTGADKFAFRFIPISYGIILLLADIITLCIVGVRTALRSKNIQYAFLRTISIVLTIPWLILYITLVPWVQSSETPPITFITHYQLIFIGLTIAAILYDTILCYFFYRSVIKQMRKGK